MAKIGFNEFKRKGVFDPVAGVNSGPGSVTNVNETVVQQIIQGNIKTILYKVIAGEGIDVTDVPPVQFAIYAGIADIETLREII
jgi:hypothetical protein